MSAYRETKISAAFETLCEAMNAGHPESSGSLAHSWHCSIAMACQDAINAFCDDPKNLGRRMTDSDAVHEIGNNAAARFMEVCFGVHTKG